MRRAQDTTRQLAEEMPENCGYVLDMGVTLCPRTLIDIAGWKADRSCRSGDRVLCSFCSDYLLCIVAIQRRDNQFITRASVSVRCRST